MLKNKNLRLVTLNDDPREQVVWNQDRPIAYLNRGDSTLDEFIELENLVQASPKMHDALWAIANHIPENWGDECKDGYVRLNISADAIDAVEDAIHPDVESTSASLLAILEEIRTEAYTFPVDIDLGWLRKMISDAIRKAKEAAIHGD